ncbi:two-component system response regulator [Neptunomonas phycophila]|uniref:Two-component system response regulator n=1 Tax=Neptunomonas phycophila TaxID=1572645 RepID=A0AAW7XQX6_9GAMM|nr:MULTISPECIES: two-component system response regulator [Neptunomonas]MDN2658881.1 two-component system response regulator [Neptunomonas sp. CHC150]MDO6455190.1 two-component system response regulator [Neptunomonas phycophila]MDO6468925.1 two-component system response regulator [Neptunomonas phycophila]MDO6782929.1 two-component system response regulator [Neptunomonas phycophila]MDP2522755.1 two-component system response regulator [Neptunomonas phycophila]
MELIQTLPPRILAVDDEPTNLKVLKNVLQDHYRLSFAKNGEDALSLIKKERPNLILLDVMMPGMTGFEVCKRLKQDPETDDIPVIFVTALQGEVDETTGFEVGGVDYILKPISPSIVKARVKTHLSMVKAEKLKKTHVELIQRLGRAAEYKDNETGMHVLRMSRYSYVIAKAAGLADEEAYDLLQAAPMHDIGKIGIPDDILLKPSKLTAEEYAHMQRHTHIGAEILGDSESGLIQLAHTVAMTHHEKWDGSGYPNGLKGENIPLAGRIVAIADVFDALTSKRPYKEAWTVEKTLNVIKKDSGTHFDPNLVELLEANLDEILRIKEELSDENVTGAHYQTLW